MSANMIKTGKSNTRQSTARQQGRRQDIGYKGAFKIPVAKDWVFRGRESQGELRSHHPGIKRIWVSNRDTQDQKNLIVVEITGTTKEVVDACFTEGRQKILESIAYDEKRSKDKAEGRKKPPARSRPREREWDAPVADENDIKPGDSVLVQKMKLAFKDAKNDPKKVAAAKAKKELEATRKKNQQLKAGNAFGALMADDEEDERASLQAQRNQAKQKATLLGPKPVVVQSKPKMTGWAALAAKPKVVVEEKVETHRPIVVFSPPKKVVRSTFESWDVEEEEIEVGGDTWEDW